MKHKTYTLRSPLSAETTIARVGELLAKAGVQYKREGTPISSTRTPIAFLGVQRTLYSNRNWVGVNPFTFISGVDVRCQAGESGHTEISLQANKVRAFWWVAFWASCSSLAALGLSGPEGAILFIVVSLAAWFGCVSFLSGYVLIKEIRNCVEAKSSAATRPVMSK